MPSKRPGVVERIVEVYRTAKGWRWRQRDPHNRLITSASTQAYARRDQALYSLATECGINLDEDRFGRRPQLEARVSVRTARAAQSTLYRNL